MRVLSGIQPSGKLHIGNYFAMMARMIEFQEKEDLFCFVANLHAITTSKDSELLRTNTFEACLDFLALGLDPEKCTFWVQSDVPEVCELTWYLNACITVPTLQKAHSYKDKVQEGIIPSQALFSYPVLMAADILAFGSEKVPVGQDQKQHLEMTRDIAISFNNRFGDDILVVPEPDIAEHVMKIPGTDGRKMSKTYGNTIDLFNTPKALKKQVMGIKTDSKAVEDPKSVADDIALYEIFCLFLDEAGKAELKNRFEAGGVGYGQIKKELLAKIEDYFAPFVEKRGHLEQDPDLVWDIMTTGANKAKAVCGPILEKVRDAVGIAKRLS